MKSKNIRRTIASPLLFIGIILTILLLIGCNLFFVLYPYNRMGIIMLVSATFLCSGGALLIFISSFRRFFSVIRIDEYGLSRSVFGKLCKLSMNWDEIYEISYFESVLPFIIISKTQSIQGLSYWKITKIKDTIQIQLTQKNYNFIKQFIKQPVIGLTDEKIQQIKLEK